MAVGGAGGVFGQTAGPGSNMISQQSRLKRVGHTLFSLLFVKPCYFLALPFALEHLPAPPTTTGHLVLHTVLLFQGGKTQTTVTFDFLPA